jgi:hypothetical protein
MADAERKRDELIGHLTGMMSAGDAETMVIAATRPNDVLAMEMTKLIWADLPVTTRSALSESVRSFLEQNGSEIAGAELISPDAQKRMRTAKS